MPRLVPEGSKQNPVRVLWEYFTSMDKFTKLFIITSLLIISVTPVIIQNKQTISQYASGINKQCLPLPKCATDGRCPEILKYKIPNTRWCIPSPTPTCMKRPACLDAIPRCMLPEPAGGWCPTPTASGCYYQPIACPAIACIKGQPCPTCPPPKLICPSPTPIPPVNSTPPSGCYYVPVACPLYCIKGQPCPTCAPKLVCPSPTPTSTCRPRPACLDAIPRCMIPETSDMCPKKPTLIPPNIEFCGTTHICSPGYTCGYCTGAIPPGLPTPDPVKSCRCIPNGTPTPTVIPQIRK